MIWILIIIAGIITFMMRYSLIALIKPENLNDTTKKVLGYVPSAVFPAMIFPAVFFNKAQTLTI
jgi:branched-subunit amino acid transport protein